MDLNNYLPQIIDLTCQIQQIPSPTFKESIKADFVSQLFREHQLDQVHLDRVGNVWGYLPGGTEKPIVISAHLDTVHPEYDPFPISLKRDSIIGPGIGDNSLAIATMITVIDFFRNRGTHLPGGIWFIGNVGEEGLGNLKGMIEIINVLGILPLAYIVLEGIGLGNIYHQALGVNRLRVAIKTPGGHSWENFMSPSAIHEMANFISSMQKINIPASPKTSYNVGVIHGGTSVNTIASTAHIEIDLRSESQESLEWISQKIISLAASFSNDKIKVNIEPIGNRPSGSISPNHPLVLVGQDALLQLGICASLGIASTDANIPLSKGLPAICIGITNGDYMHSLEEYIEIGPILKGFEQIILIVDNIWN